MDCRVITSSKGSYSGFKTVVEIDNMWQVSEYPNHKTVELSLIICP